VLTEDTLRLDRRLREDIEGPESVFVHHHWVSLHPTGRAVCRLHGLVREHGHPVSHSGSPVRLFGRRFGIRDSAPPLRAGRQFLICAWMIVAAAGIYPDQTGLLQ
jgi:hypothetical protein